MSRAVPAVAAGLKGPTGGILLVLAAAVLWSTSGIFIKVLTLSAFALTGLRAAIAFLALLPFVRLRAVRLDGTLAVLVSAFAATNLLFVVATRWTTAANAIALMSTAPAWVFLFGCLVARRVRLLPLFPLALVLSGIAAMLSEPSEGTSLQGNVLGLVAGITFAVTLIALSRINQPPVGAVALCNLGTAAGCLVLQPGAFRLAFIPGWEWLILVYLGTMQIGLAFLSFTIGMQRITVAQASVLVLLEPLLNPVWVYLAIGELPSGYGFSGYGLILSGILADQWLRLRLPGVQRPGGSVDVTARGPG
ncbi:MAG: DMT family transporter [SAR324 cluster bacterium]|nr:DMT family transporter [SAR324 cluster bacterium]